MDCVQYVGCMHYWVQGDTINSHHPFHHEQQYYPSIFETMDQIFNICVDMLERLAKIFRITYNAINVWIFVVIGPVVFLCLLLLLGIQQRSIKQLKKEITTLQVARQVQR